MKSRSSTPACNAFIRGYFTFQTWYRDALLARRRRFFIIDSRRCCLLIFITITHVVYGFNYVSGGGVNDLVLGFLTELVQYTLFESCHIPYHSHSSIHTSSPSHSLHPHAFLFLQFYHVFQIFFFSKSVGLWPELLNWIVGVAQNLSALKRVLQVLDAFQQVQFICQQVTVWQVIDHVPPLYKLAEVKILATWRPSCLVAIRHEDAPTLDLSQALREVLTYQFGVHTRIGELKLA